MGGLKPWMRFASRKVAGDEQVSMNFKTGGC